MELDHKCKHGELFRIQFLKHLEMLDMDILKIHHINIKQMKVILKLMDLKLIKNHNNNNNNNKELMDF
jgi:hypothetical protein